MAQPKVSILISFYNLASYVDETLESVLHQETNFPIEVLCADDGSTDDTVKKLRVWEQKYPDIVRVFVMDFVPGEKRPPDVRIKRLNAIRGRLFSEACGEYICYLDGDDFYTDVHKLQKQVDILDADTAHTYIACGHNGCYYWQSTGKTQPIEKPIRECSLTAKEYWSFLYIHTNALMFRNLRLQGIDPFASGVTIDDNLLTAQFLPYGSIYYLPDCMFNYRQTENSTFHLRSQYQNFMLNCFMIYELQRVDKSLFPSSLVRMIYEYTELYNARKDPALAEEAQIFMPRFRNYHAGRLCRLVNYSCESLPLRLWCEVENKFWFFMTKVFRHYIWKPKVRALLEEARVKLEQQPAAE